MTTISDTRARSQRHAGFWHRTTHVLGKLWTKLVALPEARPAGARREVPPSEYFNFPPF